jgi:F420-non-reducing hydrogenase small subunit
LCCGVATRAGCQALCPRAGAPCIGCLLPAPDVDVFERVVLRALALRFPDRGRGVIEELLEAGFPNASSQLRAYHRSAPLLRRALERARPTPAGDAARRRQAAARAERGRDEEMILASGLCKREGWRWS